MDCLQSPKSFESHYLLSANSKCQTKMQLLDEGPNTVTKGSQSGPTVGNSPSVDCMMQFEFNMRSYGGAHGCSMLPCAVCEVKVSWSVHSCQ